MYFSVAINDKHFHLSDINMFRLFVYGIFASYFDWGLTALCEDHEPTFIEVTFVIRRFIPEIRLKYKFTGQVPYIFSNITIPRWAAAFIEQFTGTDRANHNHITIRLANDWMSSIIEIAAGILTNISAALVAEQNKWRNMPLSSTLVRAAWNHHNMEFQ